MLDPQDAQDPRDPLRDMFRQAAASGQARARAVSVARIAERARRAHRRRVAVAAGAACLILAGGGVTAAALLSDAPTPVVPAVSPSADAPSPGETTGPPLSSSTAPGSPTQEGPDGDPSATTTEPSGRVTTSPP
ncbi:MULTISPECIES: hypothetical protein [unclassified Streptomyces]|uniref:hypothetical protein n=1 Tax=unclassified Streptomyces TaxID=2593676 RepID=UPI001E55589D|nr:hypothetical protein [Streptomyces sp. CB02980]MCB8901993.1 hypothetical protein [Streptomyces sp. CB02980]